MIKFEYDLKGYGWANAVLEINDKRVEFEISYLCSPIRDLLVSLLSIIPDYAITVIADGKKTKDTETRFLWLKEPGGYLWELKLLNDQALKIKISHSRSYYGNAKDWIEADTDEVLLDTKCGLNEFLKAVTIGLDNLLKEEGLLGYKQQWERDSWNYFPISELLLLKYYVLNSKGWQLAKSEEWCVDDEIRLIEQKIDPVSNKEIKSSYKRIKSVLHSLVHSFFSLMNTTDTMDYMDDYVFGVMKKHDINKLKVYFSEHKVEPAGDYSQEICKSIDIYMKWLPELAKSQNVDSTKIKDIIALVTKEADERKILVTALDDRGIRHTVQLW